MAERIRYNCALEGVIAIAVKHYFRFAPPLIITEAEIKDIVGRSISPSSGRWTASRRRSTSAKSSSLSVGDRPIAAE